ncbi:MAG: cobalt ECF transporter T component CbiQ [bacterium]
MCLPQWMLTNNAASEYAVTRPARKSNIVRRALGSFANIMRELLDNEAVAARPGLLQGVDARAKVVGLLGLLVVATLAHRPATLAIMLLVGIALALLSQVPPRRLLGAWLAVPLFSAAIMLPAMLNLITPGHAILTLWPAHTVIGPWTFADGISFTDSGLFVAGRFLLRLTVCVTLALLLTTTTPVARLFRGLRALGVPQLFVTLLGMMSRYLTVFIRAAEEIHLAKISRSPGSGSLRQEQAWVAGGMGSLYRRTRTLGDDIYLAMVARGYIGDIHLLDEPRFELSDWAFLMIAFGFAVVLLVLG